MTNSLDFTAVDLASCIESTLLSDDVSEVDIDELCTGAIWFRFAGVCVYPKHVVYAAELLSNVAVKVVTVVNFPKGDAPLADVLNQIESVVADGADEIDFVMDISHALSNDWDLVSEGIAAVVASAHQHQKLLKVILETCLLNDSQISRACQIARENGADFVKTSTGFSTGGATVEAVRLMRSVIGNSMGIKASGGIRDREIALALVNAGANRIGTSSALKIIGAVSEVNQA